jgi:hypothetical protein
MKLHVTTVIRRIDLNIQEMGCENRQVDVTNYNIMREGGLWDHQEASKGDVTDRR